MKNEIKKDLRDMERDILFGAKPPSENETCVPI
jgi:hypothetical protein